MVIPNLENILQAGLLGAYPTCFLKLHSDISVWLLRGCIDLITDVQLMQTIFSDIRRVFLPVDVILRAEGQS